MDMNNLADALRVLIAPIVNEVIDARTHDIQERIRNLELRLDEHDHITLPTFSHSINGIKGDLSKLFSRSDLTTPEHERVMEAISTRIEALEKRDAMHEANLDVVRQYVNQQGEALERVTDKVSELEDDSGDSIDDWMNEHLADRIRDAFDNGDLSIEVK